MARLITITVPKGCQSGEERPCDCSGGRRGRKGNKRRVHSGTCGSDRRGSHRRCARRGRRWWRWPVWPLINQMNPTPRRGAGVGRGRPRADRGRPGDHHQVARQSGIHPPPDARRSTWPRPSTSRNFRIRAQRHVRMVIRYDPTAWWTQGAVHRDDGRLHPRADRQRGRTTVVEDRPRGRSCPAIATTRGRIRRAAPERTCRAPPTPISPTPRSASANKD